VTTARAPRNVGLLQNRDGPATPPRTAAVRGGEGSRRDLCDVPLRDSATPRNVGLLQNPDGPATPPRTAAVRRENSRRHLCDVPLGDSASPATSDSSRIPIPRRHPSNSRCSWGGLSSPHLRCSARGQREPPQRRTPPESQWARGDAPSNSRCSWEGSPSPPLRCSARGQRDPHAAASSPLVLRPGRSP